MHAFGWVRGGSSVFPLALPFSAWCTSGCPRHVYTPQFMLFHSLCVLAGLRTRCSCRESSAASRSSSERAMVAGGMSISLRPTMLGRKEKHNCSREVTICINWGLCCTARCLTTIRLRCSTQWAGHCIVAELQKPHRRRAEPAAAIATPPLVFSAPWPLRLVLRHGACFCLTRVPREVLQKVLTQSAAACGAAQLC